METTADCCVSEKKKKALPRAKKIAAAHPDHGDQIHRLNRVSGQLAGVRRMIEERRYCPEILTQVRAAASAIRAVELLILQTHLRHCVTEAAKASPGEAKRKVDELVTFLERF